MLIDMNYWTRIIKRLVILTISLILVFFSFKLVVFYIPFLIGFLIASSIEPVIKIVNKKTKFTRKTSAVIVLLVFFSLLIALITVGVIVIISESSRTFTGVKCIYRTYV